MRERNANPEYRRIITGKRWAAVRAKKMLQNAINNGGFCEQCVKNLRTGGRRPRKATEVHHITPIESAGTRAEMEALAYDEANLIALCSECHYEAHRQIGKGHIKQTMENDINEYIDNIKNGRR